MKTLFPLILLFTIFTTAIYPQNKVFNVSDAGEFLSKINNGTEIRLQSGNYILSDYTNKSGDFYSFRESFDGAELVISGVKNLKIKGTGFTTPKVLTRPVYGNVICFEDCENIEIENIEAGHGPEKGGCTGGVFKFDNCQNIKINDCILFGSGTEGINCSLVTGLKCNNTIIKGCTYGILTLDNSANIDFVKCDFTNNMEFDMITINLSSNVLFDKCYISNNKSGHQDYSDYSLFRLDWSSGILLKNCEIKNNYMDFFSNDRYIIKLENTDITNNKFAKGEFIEG